MRRRRRASVVLAVTAVVVTLAVASRRTADRERPGAAGGDGDDRAWRALAVLAHAPLLLAQLVAAGWVDDAAGAVSGFFGRIVSFIAGPVVDALKAAFRRAFELVEALVRFIAGLLQAGVDAAVRLAGDAMSLLREVPGWIQTAAQGVKSFVTDWVPRHVVAALAAFGRAFVEPLARMVTSWWDRLVFAARWVADYAGRLVEWVDRWLGTAVDFLARAGRWLLGFAIGVGRDLVDFFTRVGRWLLDFALDVGRTLVRYFLDFGRTLWEWLRDHAFGLVFLFGPFWPLVDLLWRNRAAIVDFLTDPLGFVRERLQRLVAISRRWLVENVTTAAMENASRWEDFLVRWWGT